MWQYYRDEPGEADNAAIADSKSFKSKVKIAGKNHDAGNTKDVEIAVLLKYLSNFLRPFKMSLINCEINFILTFSANFVITN